jgi:hypothetical protein
MYLAFKKAIKENVPVGKLWMTVNGWLLDKTAQKNGRGKPDVKHFPLGITADKEGSIFVTDHFSHCVQKYKMVK